METIKVSTIARSDEVKKGNGMQDESGKSQFSDIQLFIQHKKQSCSPKKPRRAEAAGVESEQEVYITVESSPFSPLADKSKLEQRLMLLTIDMPFLTYKTCTTAGKTGRTEDR